LVSAAVSGRCLHQTPIEVRPFRVIAVRILSGDASSLRASNEKRMSMLEVERDSDAINAGGERG
jgi:hypothetical protein